MAQFNSGDLLRFWEQTDLDFHRRSRGGHGSGPLGATLRFKDLLDPPPAVKPPMSDHRVLLPRAMIKDNEPKFQAVLNARRSIRQRTGRRRSLSLACLGEFLDRVARVKETGRSGPVEFQRRPYPSGGGLHELEIYLTLRRAAGPARPGLYHYRATEHALYALPATPKQCRNMLESARLATNANEPPDVLVTFAARIARVAWKYEGMAYRTILLNAGAVIQTMYLVAAAMDLAPCAVGNGDSVLFAASCGVNELEEPAVAEFALWI